MGGTLFGLWPNAASALTCLRRRLPLMPGTSATPARSRRRWATLTGVRVVPDPPQVPMMHLLLSTTPERFAAAARRLAAEQRIWVWPTAMTTGDPGRAAAGAILWAVPPGRCNRTQVRDIIAALIAG